MVGLIHSLVIQRSTHSGSEDDYGQPGNVVSEVAVKGLVQPRSTREAQDSRSAGTPISTHVIFLPLATTIDEDDAIVHDSRRYQVVGIRHFDFGKLAHLEVDANVTGSAVAEVGS